MNKENTNQEACIFCDIINNTLPSHEVFQNHQCKVVLDIKPITQGHIIIIAKTHQPLLHQLPDEEYIGIFRVAKSIAKQLPLFLDEVTAANLVVNDGKDSGQHIPHVHIHIIPRRKNDSLSFYWRLLTRFINPFSQLNQEKNLSETREFISEHLQKIL